MLLLTARFAAEELQPSAWVLLEAALPSPYVPQLGDTVVYLRQVAERHTEDTFLSPPMHTTLPHHAGMCASRSSTSLFYFS